MEAGLSGDGEGREKTVLFVMANDTASGPLSLFGFQTRDNKRNRLADVTSLQRREWDDDDR